MNRLVIVLVGSLSVAGARADEPLAGRLRKLDLKTLDTTRAWNQDLRSRRNAVNLADQSAWHAIHTREDWDKFKTPRIDALRASLGAWPTPMKNPVVAITKRISGDGFQIANLLYETRPGFFVTANLYSPVQPGDKMPGILICTSHHNPKTQGELQDMGMTWARLGCLVLVPDQLGHGERRNHPFTDVSKYPATFKAGRQDYYFRYYEALQLHLIGESLMGWMVWDMMRGVDVLLSRQGIDQNAVILLGSVAGGGDPAAVTAALDPRVMAVAPFNFGGPQPKTKYPLPDDAAASFNYLGGGSWESTRNLRLSGQGGFLPWVIVGSVAPRGLIYGHEFAWDRDRDPVWARLRKIYGFYDTVPRLASVHGRGAVTGQPPNATHCNNIGPEHRLQMYPTLKTWFGIAVPDKDYQKRLPAEDLLCWTHDAQRTYQAHSLSALAEEKAKEMAARVHRDRLAMRKRWHTLLGDVNPSPRADYTVNRSMEPVLVEKGVRRDGLGAYALIHPLSSKKGEKYPVIVAFAQDGMQALVKNRAEVVAALLENGVGVCLVELRGMGSKGDRGRGGTSTSLSATELMLGQTVIGHHLRELRELLAHLRKHESVDGARLALWGDSLARANPPEHLLEVPLDAAKMPDLAEPGCCLLALLGAFFEEDVRAVYGRGGLVSYRSVLRSPFVYVPHDAIVPGSLTAGDWADLAAALAPRALRLEALVDGLNRRVTMNELDKAYLPARDAFAKAGPPVRFALTAEPSSPEALARWFVAALKK